MGLLRSKAGRKRVKGLGLFLILSLFFVAMMAQSVYTSATNGLIARMRSPTALDQQSVMAQGRRALLEAVDEEAKQEGPASEEEEEGSEEKDEEEGEEEEEEEGEDGVIELKDLRVVTAIIILLISLTVAFEVAKENLEESVPEDYGVILEKFFGELTILGFLSMVTFLVSQFGVMAMISDYVYGEEGELGEHFEMVHFCLFFIMVGFVVQVLGMISEADDQQEEWHKIDEIIRHEKEHHHSQDEHDLMEALHNAPWYTMLCTRLWSGAGFVAQREAAVFKALRTEFILDRSLKPPHEPAPLEKRVDENFNFGRYLGFAQIHILSHVVEVENETWFFFAILAAIFYFISLAVGNQIVYLAWVWAGMGWLVYLSNFFFVAHLLSLRNIFLPHMEGYEEQVEATEQSRLMESAKNGNGNGATHHLPKWTKIDIETHLSQRSFVHDMFVGKHKPNKQQAHYWLEREGPRFYTFLLQVNLLFLGIYAGLLIIMFYPAVWEQLGYVEFAIYFIASMIPMIGVVFNKRDIVAFMAQVTSVGTYRKDQIIRDVMREEATIRIVRTFIIIHRLRKVAEKGLPMDDHNDKNLMRHATFSELEIDEVGHSFDIFDTDNSGSISKEEFRELMQRLGADTAHMHFDALIDSLDADKDGEVGRDEFIAWYQFYSEKRAKEEGLEEMAEEMFEMFNPDGHGEITIGELRAEIEALDMGFKPDEIAAILHELDKDRSGTISPHEFEEFLEKFYPKELTRER